MLTRLNLKSLGLGVTFALTLGCSTTLYAQGTDASQAAGKTRAEVRGELQQLEGAGYRPGGEGENYPVDVQNAQRALTAAPNAAATSVGGTPAGTSAAGAPARLGKTRDQVRQELDQARKSGEMERMDGFYGGGD